MNFKNLGKAAAHYATMPFNPLGYVGAAAGAVHALGGKNEKQFLNDMTGGLTGKLDETFGSNGIQDFKGSVTPKVYNPTGYTINEAPFKTSQDYQGLRDGFATKGNDYGAAATSAQFRPASGMGPQSPFRGDQQALVSQLQQQAAGQGPSLASLQMQQNTDNAIKSAMALAASGRSGSAGGRLKMAQDQAAAYQQQGARDSAALRIQEQLAARDQLAGVLGQARGQDIDVSGRELAAMMQQKGLNDQYSLGLGNLGLGYDKLGLDAYGAGSNDLMDLEKLKLQKYIEEEKLKQAGIQSQNTAQGGLLGSMGGLLAAFGTKSDRRAKTNIKDGDKSAKSFLTAVSKNMGIEKPNYEEMPSADRMKKFMSRLKTYEYDYKDPKDGVGKKISPMAQDLENDPMTASMVTDTKEGKIVNYNQPGMLMAGLATLSRENDEIRKMVAKMAKKRSA